MKKFLVIFLIGCPAAIYGQIWQVPADFTTIQAAINSAEDGDTIILVEGIYKENINYAGKQITVGSLFVLDGDTSHISRTIIDGSNPPHPDSGSVVTFDSGETVRSILKGLTLKGGSGTISHPQQPSWNIRCGGGILVDKCGALIEDNVIHSNSLMGKEFTLGGGISAKLENPGDSVIIRNNRVCNNYSRSDTSMVGGGGIAVTAEQGYADISSNEVYNNVLDCQGSWKGMGGGIMLQKLYGNPVTMEVNANYIHHNCMEGDYGFGGGIYLCYPFNPAFEHLIDLEENVPVSITNNIISNNSIRESGSGGGIAIWNMAYDLGSIDLTLDPVLINNTIFENSCNENGTGAFNYDAETLMMNNIIWNQNWTYSEIFCGSHIPYPYYNSANTGALISRYNTIRDGWDLQYDMSAKPVFEDGSFELKEGCLSIGRGAERSEADGETYDAPELDFFGNPRKNHSEIDLGACESSYPRTDTFYFVNSYFTGDWGNYELYYNVAGGIPPYTLYVNGDKQEIIPVTGLSNGEYNLKLIDAEGEEIETQVIISGLIQRCLGFSDIKVFPCPASDVVSLEFEIRQLQNIAIELVNLQGRVVLEKRIPNLFPGRHRIDLDVSSLAPGIHLIRVNHDRATTGKIFVK